MSLSKSTNLLIQTVLHARHVPLNLTPVLVQSLLILLHVVADAVKVRDEILRIPVRGGRARRTATRRSRRPARRRLRGEEPRLVVVRRQLEVVRRLEAELGVGDVLLGQVLQGLDGLDVPVEGDLDGAELGLDKVDVAAELLNVALVLGHELADLVLHLDDAGNALVDQGDFVLDRLGEVVETAAGAEIVVVDLDGGDLRLGWRWLDGLAAVVW